MRRTRRDQKADAVNKCRGLKAGGGSGMTGGEHCGAGLLTGAGPQVGNRVYAAVHEVQASATRPAGQGVRRDAGGQHIGPGHQAVLARREPLDLCQHGSSQAAGRGDSLRRTSCVWMADVCPRSLRRGCRVRHADAGHDNVA